jgi:hypothetical protein
MKQQFLDPMPASAVSSAIMVPFVPLKKLHAGNTAGQLVWNSGARGGRTLKNEWCLAT